MDVFDFAMKMELQGKAFYETQAASTQIIGLKTVFAGLAADEQKHYDLLRGLKEGKEWRMVDSPMLDRAKTVFTDLVRDKESVGEMGEDLDGYRLGLKMEADSVRLYEDLAKKADDPDMVQLYLRLANEEKGHYNIIENICDFVTRPKYYLTWRDYSNLEE